MCLFPRLVANPKYRANKKNGGIIPPIKDRRVLYVPIKCGECKECRKQKTNEWTVRLLEDIKHHKNGHMVTLTFNTKSLVKLYDVARKKYEIKELWGYELDNAVCKVAIRRFCERYRKKYKKALRHFVVTELGHSNTEHVHMHGIVWTNAEIEEIKEMWGYGFVWSGYNNQRTYVNGKTINYTVKYITKIDPVHKEYKQIILSSNGIGGAYIKRIQAIYNKYNGENTNEAYQTDTGHKMSLPIYFRNKIYSEEEREQLWIHKLNKEKRYVLGQEIDVSKNLKEYREALKYAQFINYQQNYGDGRNNWSRLEYEQQWREMKQSKRINEYIEEQWLAETFDL